MGERVEGTGLSPEDRLAERDRLHRELDRLHGLVHDDAFARPSGMVGAEVEFHLVGPDGEPRLTGHEVLAAIGERAPVHDFQTELARFNVELNLPPVPLADGGLDALVRALDTAIGAAQHAAGDLASLVMIGTLPTLTAAHADHAVLADDPRYRLLDQSILGARGESITIAIDGHERLECTLASIALEAAATSMQTHLEETPASFPRSWNAAQAVAAAQVALGANAPFLLGAHLWHETRIPLFEQVIDTRSRELAAQGVRPRVWFGERWIDSVTDLFDENVRYFPPLLPQRAPEDDPAIDDAAAKRTEAQAAPALAGLRLHNGTVWRWNRPVYAVADGRAYLRLENRVLPSGPTVADTVANIAFLAGTVRALAARDEPIEARLAFADAAGNFHRAARHGPHTLLAWPGRGTIRATDLVLEELLPLAHEGLAAAGIGPAERHRHLDIIAERARSGRTGAVWQTREVRRLMAQAGEPDALPGSPVRSAALAAMVRRYLALQRSGAPVATWPDDATVDEDRT
jgi:hypothetical protein